MVLSENTSIYISLGTLFAILLFVRKASSYTKGVEMKISSINTEIKDIKKRFDEHEELDSKQNISVRLASIEANLEWIKNKLMGK